MLQTTDKKATSTKTHQNVEKKAEKWYSEDELNNEIIEAYKNFEKKLTDEIKKTLKTQLATAKKICENIYHSLNEEKGIKCKKVFLRTNSLISFEAIIVIPEKPFLSDAFDKAYEIAFREAKPFQKSDFNFDFNFMPSTRHINSNALVTDGFNLSFQPLKTNG